MKIKQQSDKWQATGGGKHLPTNPHWSAAVLGRCNAKPAVALEAIQLLETLGVAAPEDGRAPVRGGNAGMILGNLAPGWRQRQADPICSADSAKRGEGSLWTATTCAAPRHSSRVTRHGEQGIALVITLIMLAVTLVMAVAFLALARRERGSVTTTTDTAVAQLAARTAVDAAQAQIVAGFLGTNYFVSSNAYNLSLIVSTNYINAYGFTTGSGNPTNVNYSYGNGSPLTIPDFEQNVSNLWYLPRVPVFVPTNQPQLPLAYDFRYYLDLNENGEFEPNGWQRVISDSPADPYYDTNGIPTTTFTPPNVLSNFMVGDPEWVGVLEHPDAPHGPNNHFTSRYAFIAVPVGNTMDINYIHNQARNTSLSGNDGYMRNQGVGSWEINLAAFFADLNTNIWSPQPLPDNLYYAYNEPNNYANNSGYAFQDALALLRYRYNNLPLPSANNVFFNAGIRFPFDGIDNYSQGPLQFTLDTNEDFLPPPVNTTVPWSGADNTNHFFTLNEFFNGSNPGLAAFTNRLRNAGTWTVNGLQPTYDRYTFYRMLNELGTDSSPEEGKVNLNYSNTVVKYVPIPGTPSGPTEIMPTSIGIVAGAETNLVKWRAVDFFHAAADQMLRTYSAYWYSVNPVAYTNTFGITNSYFTVTNIPVWVSNRFVYTPAVNRLLQLAANIYDATTNGNNNLPHVFKPILERVDNNGDIFIVGYKEVAYVSGLSDPDLQRPVDITSLTNAAIAINKPIVSFGRPVNVYGVPWIIGAKKGLPNFNQFYMVSAAQVTRKLELRRDNFNPRTTYHTNQMYIIGISNNLGVSFWNSYDTNYLRPLTVVAREGVYMGLTNDAGLNISGYYYSTNVAYTINQWPGSKWTATRTVPQLATPKGNSFLNLNSWAFNFINPSVYRFGSHSFDPVGLATSSTFEVTTPPLPQLPQFGVAFTNQLQAFILDGNNVVDYVQLRDPVLSGGLNQALADLDYPAPGNAYLQWSTNAYPSAPPTPYGVINQIWVSQHPANAPVVGGKWSAAPTPMGTVSPDAEAAYFSGFFKPTFFYNGHTYVNHQLVMQAPYTPSRTVYSSFLLQANDPLVHYLSSDLNSQVGAYAVWAGAQTLRNGLWYRSDDPLTQPLPTPPATPLNGRYQPWGRKGQLATVAGTDGNTNNLSYKDPLVWGSDYWDFPTNSYPTVGWLGRVHRGTPWQTVYLKSTNILSYVTRLNSGIIPNGALTWANWTGDIQTNLYSAYFDTFNSAPQQDYLLFDIFTTRFNDNAARGTLPVNVGVGQSDGGLAAWSALFSGMVVLTNDAPRALSGMPLTYTPMIINPAGVEGRNSALWKIVNDPTNGINATRANTNFFPYQTFAHVGQILATPALSTYSPFLNQGSLAPLQQQWAYGINDEMYEWLPQQMMGLVRATEPRFVLYGFGQTLRPAPGGTVLSGPYFQLVTNYQVVAESAVRVVIRVDNANTSKPHAVVESYNVLPPN